jgi:hypothetical protein
MKPNGIVSRPRAESFENMSASFGRVVKRNTQL